MEEKERYEIHIYDDVCVDLYDNGVLDKSVNDTYKLEELLNQQSKRIKELEEEVKVGEFWHSAYQGKQLYYDMVYAELRKAMDENEQLKQQLAEKDKEIEKYRNANIIVVGERSQGKKHLMEIKIKELQNQKAIEVLEKIKDDLLDISSPYWQYFVKSGNAFMTYEDIEQWTKEFIDDKIKELKGGI